MPRALRSAFIDTWEPRLGDAQREADRLRQELMTAGRDGRLDEFVPLAGQTVGLIHDIRPAQAIVQQLVVETEAAFQAVSKNITPQVGC